MEEKSTHFVLISVVAIVAIVGIVSMITISQSRTITATSLADYITESDNLADIPADKESNVAGEARIIDSSCTTTVGRGSVTTTCGLCTIRCDRVNHVCTWSLGCD